MPLNQSGDHASISIGTSNDVAGNQYIFYNRSATPDLKRDAIQQILKKLDPADMDATHREECLPGTRTDITDFILEWVQSTEPLRKHKVLWLRGLAGSGKSTLSTTIANRLTAIGRLAAFIFFERDVSARSDPSTVIRTMAYKLGVSHPTAGAAISTNVTKYPEITHFTLRSQFQHLLTLPMTSRGTVDKNWPVVFVLDALDECGNPSTRETLLELLAEQSSILPVLFVVTSRPLQDICGFFEDRDNVLIKELDITTKYNNDDISTFLAQSMRRIKSKHLTLRRRRDWPGDEKLEQLMSRASGLFIWASTVCKFIGAYQPDVRLEMIIHGAIASTAEHSLDDLYRTALEFSGSWDIPEFVSDFRGVLGFILVARRPLSSDNIISLLGNSVTDSCIDNISQLGSVLQLDPTVRLLHPSFADFLCDEQRCIRQDFLFEEVILHCSVALLCIEHMNTILKENIYDIMLSPNVVHAVVPEDMAYACTHWIEHVCMAADTTRILPALEILLRQHLLHWVEAMSILKISRATIGMLERLHAWICMQAVVVSTELAILVDDGIRFVRLHADVIETHPLLVYSSALPFTPKDTMLYKIFHDPSLHPVSRGLVEKSWSPLLQVLTDHSDFVNSVAFSSDGTRIVSGSYDKTIRVWDAASGIQILPVLRGHEGSVYSVALSPDCTRIASGSSDTTIRLWNTSLGTEVFPPLRGHDGFVRSVIFTPCGQYIISASDDESIRVWYTNTGAEARPPLEGHSDCILSVSCSYHVPTRIVSGSSDKTVRVWDMASGLELVLRGHTSIVNSVTFSPDGSCVASASNDTTIRLWDAKSGVQIQLLSLKDPPECVRSVAFSADGNRIVSGSDMAIRIWNVSAGIEASLPLTNNHLVYSTCFSPDGTRVISGASDGTVRVWDATRPTGGSAPYRDCHMDRVCSFAFSPDGTRIVSGATDSTVRVWDTASGAQILPPLRGHGGDVVSVAVSPDGTQIISGSNDWTVRIYDATTGLEIMAPLQHIYPVTSVTFSSDGRYIISRCDSWNLKFVWDAVSGTRMFHEVPAPPMPLATGEVDLHMLSGWISHRITHNYLSRLPSNIKPRANRSYGRFLAVGGSFGEVFGLQFPVDG